jgi:hypothetical protein
MHLYGKPDKSAKIFKTKTNHVKQANQNLKMATAKGIRTPWIMFKLVLSHASESIYLKRNESLFTIIIHYVVPSLNVICI